MEDRPTLLFKTTTDTRRQWNYFSCLVIFYLLVTTSHVSGQQQSFRKRPENLEVKLNGTAELKCEVENQAGRVQWTRGGFALGFERSIPHFPRYSMVGDAGRGIHNLRIVNVSLEDISEYQCQVGPTKTNTAIRADAWINVLVPPTSIQILNHAADAILTLRERDQTELECVVRESRPAATIIWLRNDTPYKADSRDDTYEEIEVVENGISIRKNTTKSKIRILPTAEDDRARFTCEGRHAALERPMRVSLQFSVQYPPGAPRIDGYHEGVAIPENKSVTLICVSRGGNPVADLTWFRNDIQVMPYYRKDDRPTLREARHEYTFTATTRDNMAVYRCESANSMTTTPKIADVTLTVYFSAKEVKVSGPKEAKVGDTVTLTCQGGNSNPKADIAWFKGGIPLEAGPTTWTPSTDGGHTASSNVTFRVLASDRKETYTCQVLNRGTGDTKSATHTIHVIQPPGHPIIYNAQANITAGQSQRLTCTSTGGYPTATLTWYKGNVKVPASLIAPTTNTPPLSDGTATATLEFVANMTDNGVEYKCEAKNKAIAVGYTETVTFGVLFPPAYVNISTKPTKFKAGQRGYLTCESSSSNPPARVSFTKNSQVVSGPLNQTLKNSTNGGMKTTITLELNLTSEHDGDIYMCEAKNSAVRQSLHTSIKLDVSYKPKFVETGGEKVTVVEGEGTVVRVKAKGNPDEIKYKWSRNNSVVKSVTKRLGVDGPVLNFTEVNRKDKGKYEVEATNSEGTTKVQIDIDVQYPATVLTTADSIMVGQTENAHLECGIDANPLDESMVVWKYGDAEISRPTQKKFLDKKAYLTILDVNVTDAGLYSCFVNNGIGSPVNKSIFLIVKQKPDIDKSPQIAKAASNKGATAKLICRAKASPNVTFSWGRKDGVPINTTMSTKYSIQTRMIDRMNFESILEVREVQTEDYGLYNCICSNEIDMDTHDVQLDVTSVPDTPLRFRVVNSTDNSIMLTWDPGFNGGFEQTYNIMYFEIGGEPRKYVDVHPKGVTTYEVTGLNRGKHYGFRIKGVNKLGSSNYTTEDVQYDTTNWHENPKFWGGRPDLTKLVIVSASIVGTLLLILNIFIITYFLYKRKNAPEKSKEDEASEQGSSKSATIEMYAPSSYNETVTGETLSSISEKSATYSQGEHHDEYIDDEGKGHGGVSTYLVEHINHHHSSAFPYQRGGTMAHRASTLPRQPKNQTLSAVEPRGYAEDDGYVDSFRKNAYNQGTIGDNIPIYGRTTPRPTSSRPPQVPPIPELYNIPPEARYVSYPPPVGFGSPVQSNGSLRHLPPSASQELLNSNPVHQDPMTSFLHIHHHAPQPNGRLVSSGAGSNGTLSPQRHSILTTFIPNPSPNMEHEGHLV